MGIGRSFLTGVRYEVQAGRFSAGYEVRSVRKVSGNEAPLSTRMGMGIGTLRVSKND